jgi:hypothetical protein
MNTTKTTKQTAKNNKFLQGVKKIMGAKIYAKTLELVNISGTHAAVEYLQYFFNAPVSVERFENSETFWKN